MNSDNQTDKLLAELEQRISRVYNQAWSEVRKTSSDYFASLRKRYEEEYKAFQDGKYTKAQFDAWYLAQVGRGRRWEKLRNEISERMTNANEVAASYINDATPGIYSLNANYASYEIEKASGIDFTIYDERTVERILTGKHTMLPPSRVDIPVSDKWNREKLQSALTSGILQGHSIDKIADDFQRVTDMDRNSAIRNARTAVTGAQNAGRQDTYNYASSMGIEIEKEWISTIDSRTRESHKELDGVQVPYNEQFPNGLDYPGDYSGAPEEVYNCRCTMRAILPKYNGAARTSKMEGHEGVHTNETYKEWLDRKREEKMLRAPYTSADATFRAMEDSENKRKQ